MPLNRPLLESLQIHNLKGFGAEQRLALAPITLIYGQNSAGKSSVLQSLLLLKQTFEAQQEGSELASQPLVARGSLADLASFKSLVHRHDLSKDLTLGLSYREPPPNRRTPSRGASEERSRRLSFRFAWRERVGQANLVKTSLTLGRDRNIAFDAVSYKQSEDGESQMFMRLQPRSVAVLADELDQLLPNDSQVLFRADERQRARGDASYPTLVRNNVLPGLARNEKPAVFTIRSLLPADFIGSEGDLAAFLDRAARPVSQISTLRTRLTQGDDAGLALWTELHRTLRQELAGLFERMHYLGPLREPPQRFTIRSGTSRRSVGTTGAHSIEMLHQRRGLLGKVNDWLSRLGVPYTAEVQVFTSDEVEGTFGDVLCLLFADSRSGVRAASADVGFGVSQVLPLVVQSLVSRREVIVIEQPEIHLHPRLQAELGDLFIHSSADLGNQFIVETHSEHVVLRIQRRVREGLLDSRQVAILYVDGDELGNAQVISLRLDESGDFIDEWPLGFFEERYKELFS